MTLMLASVTNPAEAEAVWAAGADIIDLKDPAKGALGALDADVAAGIVRSVGKRKPVSAAAGASLGAPGAIVDAVPRWQRSESIMSRLVSHRTGPEPMVCAHWGRTQATPSSSAFSLPIARPIWIC